MNNKWKEKCNNEQNVQEYSQDIDTTIHMLNDN